MSAARSASFVGASRNALGAAFFASSSAFVSASAFAAASMTRGECPHGQNLPTALSVISAPHVLHFSNSTTLIGTSPGLTTTGTLMLPSAASAAASEPSALRHLMHSSCVGSLPLADWNDCFNPQSHFTYLIPRS